MSYDILLFNIFDNYGYIFFMDASFTNIKLFRALHSRGIYAVGPMNATKPYKRTDGNSWSHRYFKKGDYGYLARDWDRKSYTKLSSGGWMSWWFWLAIVLFAVSHHTVRNNRNWCVNVCPIESSSPLPLSFRGNPSKLLKSIYFIDTYYY